MNKKRYISILRKCALFFWICALLSVSVSAAINPFESNLSDEDIFQKMQDLAQGSFYGNGVAPQIYPPSPSFTYKDSESGLSFTVPENWIESPMSEERTYIDAKFTSRIDDSICIVFCSENLYESEAFQTELSLMEKLSISSQMIDNDFFSVAEIAEMYGCAEHEISLVSYGENDYYSAKVIATTTVDGTPLSVPMVSLLRLENGYMYYFQFVDYGEDMYFEDFKSLVSSAEYPQFEDDGITAKGLATYIPVIFFSLVATLVAYGAFPLIFAKTRKKFLTKKKYTLLCFGVNFLIMLFFIAVNGSSSGGPYALWTGIFSACGIKTLKRRGILDGLQPHSSTFVEVCGTENVIAISEKAPIAKKHNPIKLCHHCGESLPDDSEFCPYCGTKLILDNTS